MRLGDHFGIHAGDGVACRGARHPAHLVHDDAFSEPERAQEGHERGPSCLPQVEHLLRHGLKHEIRVAREIEEAELVGDRRDAAVGESRQRESLVDEVDDERGQPSRSFQGWRRAGARRMRRSPRVLQNFRRQVSVPGLVRFRRKSTRCRRDGVGCGSARPQDFLGRYHGSRSHNFYGYVPPAARCS